MKNGYIPICPIFYDATLSSTSWSVTLCSFTCSVMSGLAKQPWLFLTSWHPRCLSQPPGSWRWCWTSPEVANTVLSVLRMRTGISFFFFKYSSEGMLRLIYKKLVFFLVWLEEKNVVVEERVELWVGRPLREIGCSSFYLVWWLLLFFFIQERFLFRGFCILNCFIIFLYFHLNQE